MPDASQHLSFLPWWLVALCMLGVFVLGACVGSFVNCAALRRSTGESVLNGRSRCPACGHTLGAGELVPLVSWLAQKGRCRHCGVAVSARYPLVELVAGIAAVLAVLPCVLAVAQGQPVSFQVALAVQNLLFTFILLYCSLVDLDSRIIPNACIVAALVVRIAYIAVFGALGGDWAALARFSLVGGFAVFLPLLVVVLVADRVFGRDSMGGGDLKLLFLAGLYFGWRQSLFLIVIACIIGIAAALIQQREERQRPSDSEDWFDQLRHRQIPFGPAIAIACVVTMVVGQPLVDWYAGFF